jgi:hypothetical protein
MIQVHMDSFFFKKERDSLKEKSDLKYVFTLPSYWELGRGEVPFTIFSRQTEFVFM